MSLPTPSTPAAPAQSTPASSPKGYVVLPPEVEAAPDKVFSGKFVVFTIFVIGLAIVGGLAKSGKPALIQYVTLSHYFNVAKAAAMAPASGAAAAPASQDAAAPAAPVAQKVSAAPAENAAGPAPSVVTLDPNTFVVTSISIGQPSFAIINGTAKVVGDAVEASGVTGWKVSQIEDGTVWLQNGASLAALHLSTPGIKALDDNLRPLN